VSDRAGDELVAFGLAVNSHKAHGNAADGRPWGVLEEARLAVGAEALEKRYDPAEKAHYEPDIEITDIRRHGMFLLGLSPGLGRRQDHIMDISGRIRKALMSLRKVTCCNKVCSGCGIRP
jgi:hypothetical protein